jgi:beta-lactamase regulating signal transducer with metallopeptidase domain
MHNVPFADLVAWFAAAFRGFAQTAAPVAIAGLWQGAAVALGLSLCLHFAPRVSAAHRFAAWATGFLVAAGLGWMPVLAHFLAAANSVGASGMTGAAAKPWLAQPIFERPLFEIDARWTLAIAALWLALAAFRAVDLAVHSLRLRQLWKSATPTEDGFTTTTGRRVEVCTTRALNQPGVIGFFWPRILIPERLYARLTPGELEQVVLHEAEHLRRRDDWTNLLQKLCLVLFPLNPALAWMEHRLRSEREMACDEGVVRVTRAPRAYAACLASLAERGLEQSRERGRAATALSLGAFERRSELVGRVHSILRRNNVLSPLGAGALLGAVGCGLLAASVELARCPQVVEFVSAPSVAQVPAGEMAPLQTAQMEVAPGLPAHATDLVARDAAGYRATNAVAILPAAAERRAMHPEAQTNLVASAQTGREPNAIRVAWGEARQKLAETQAENGTARLAPRGAAEQDADGPQQWIVLTTWEHVGAPATGSDEVADYDTGANPDAAGQNAAEPGGAGQGAAGVAQPAQSAPGAQGQTTITQLFLRVYPENSTCARGRQTQRGVGANSRGFNSRGSNSESDLNRTAILPLDSGWLFIQL